MPTFYLIVCAGASCFIEAIFREYSTPEECKIRYKQEPALLTKLEYYGATATNPWPQGFFIEEDTPFIQKLMDAKLIEHDYPLVLHKKI